MKLPELREEKEIKFWDRHSIGDYWEDLVECDDTFKRPNPKTVTLKFDPLILQKIKMLAKKRGLLYSAYVRYLLSKSIEDEIMNRQSYEKM